MGKKIKTDDELLYKYRAIRVKGKRYDLHRYIMQTILGRELSSNEVVHHKDGNKLNNDPSNLEVMTRAEHTILHGINTGVSRHWQDGRYDNVKKGIAAFDITTKKLLCVYPSIAEASRNGYTYSSILRCLKGRLKTHKNCTWHYISEPGIHDAIARGSLELEDK